MISFNRYSIQNIRTGLRSSVAYFYVVGDISSIIIKDIDKRKHLKDAAYDITISRIQDGKEQQFIILEKGDPYFDAAKRRVIANEYLDIREGKLFGPKPKARLYAAA